MSRRRPDHDPSLTAIAYGAMGLIGAAFWLWLASLFVPTVVDALRAAGSLNACVERGLRGAECSAFAQGENQ